MSVPDASPIAPALSAEFLPQEVLETPGPLLLAFPGGGCAPEIYREVQHPGLRVHVMDWGRWPGPWLLPVLAQRTAAALSRRCGLTLLAGHSVGGVIAMLTALAAPDAVHGLLLANTGAHTEGLGDPDLPARIRESWSDQMATDFLRSCFWRDPPASLWPVLVEYLAGIDRELFAQATQSLRSLDLREQIGEIRCPTVIAFGRHDGRRGLPHAYGLADGIAQASLMLLPAGHTPMVEAPAQYNEALALLLMKATVRTHSVSMK